MVRAKAFIVIGALGAGVSGCEGLLGSVDLASAPERSVEPAEPSAGVGGSPPQGTTAPARDVPTVMWPAPVSPAPEPPRPPVTPDAGADAGGDAAPAPPVPVTERPVLVEGPPAPLELVGFIGGEPYLGACQGGVVIGVQPTANPEPGVFGERLTFIEPICGALVHHPGSNAGGDGVVRVTRADALLDWSSTEPFLGEPPRESPDERVIWQLQPAALCPEAAPVLVGLRGQFNAPVPDTGTTAVFRSLTLECAPLIVADNGIDIVASPSERQLVARVDSFAAAGPAAYQATCEEGRVPTQLLVHAGFWLDGFVLECASLRSPKLEGEPCTSGAECQSTVCTTGGACGP